MRYHLTEEGPKPCRAEKRPCPIGGEHFEGLKDARGAYEERLSQELNGLVGLKQIAGDELSAAVSRDYAHWSIISDHLHNATRVGNEAELLYYATAQGQLELERRLQGKYPDKDLLRVRETLEAGPLEYKFMLDEEYVRTQAEEGEKLAPRSSSFLLDEKGPNRHNGPLRHYLVEHSQKWLNRLSTEEQEAISWLTSNGFSLAQHAIGVRDDSHRYIFENLIDRRAIDKKHPYDWDKAEADFNSQASKLSGDFLKRVLSAFEKAPALEEPIVIARGTSVAELHDLVGQPGVTNKELFDRLERGDYNGTNVADSARMSKIPLSATVAKDVAASFAKNEYSRVDEDREVYITVKTRTLPTPVNVGAWSAGEAEVFINPLKKHKIVNAERKEIMGDQAFLIELEELI